MIRAVNARNVFFPLVLAAGAVVAPAAADQPAPTKAALEAPAAPWLASPQWCTSARLLRLGESIDFNFWTPANSAIGELCIFPRYLEQAAPGDRFKVGETLPWLESQSKEVVPLSRPQAGPAIASYRPKSPGNYLARWQVNGETLYRYFSVIDNSYAVVRFGGYYELPLHSSLHATGIPVDFPLPMERCKADDELYQRFCNYQRLYGDGIVPQLPDMPETTDAQRRKKYQALLERARQMLPDPAAARCARIEMWHERDPGYAKTLGELGVVSHFGLQMANGGSWLGMPEFPYFVAPTDLRKTDQEPDQGPQLVTHQWDFCGGWHFLGPTSWHWSISNHQWKRAEDCLTRGVAEAVLAAENSGRPAFIFPLYDGNLEETDENRAFVERYQRWIALDMTKRFHLVFARAVDVADYYRRHEPTTPRTVYISKTDADEIFYVMHWNNLWAGRHELLAREQLPWLTRISSIHQLREMVYGAKDPMSFEHMVVEDQRRSLRFERMSPNPVWWTDYAEPPDAAAPQGSMVHWKKTPDVDWLTVSATEADLVGRPPLAPQWEKSDASLKLQLKMATESQMQDYAIVLWSLPPTYAARPDPSRIRTTASSFLVAKNPAGEYHLYLEFDLAPNKILDVEILD